MAIENTITPTIRDGNLAWFSIDSKEKQRASMGIFVVDILRRKYQEYTFGLKIFDYRETANYTKRFGFTHIETNVDIKNSSIHKTFVKIHALVFSIINSLKSLWGYVKGIFIKKIDEKRSSSKQTARKPDETINGPAITKGTLFWFSKNFETRQRHRLGLFKRVDILKQRYKEYFLGFNIFNKYKTTIEERKPFFMHKKSIVEIENGIIHRVFILISSIFSFTLGNLNVIFGYIKAPFIKKQDTKT